MFLDECLNLPDERPFAADIFHSVCCHSY
jgi:hypothetical protein